MATMIYLYPLFALLIALRLDSYKAAFPPPGFKDVCLIIVEAYWLGGFWAYDPDEEVIEGIPTMYKLKQQRFSNDDLSLVRRESDIEKRLFLSWHRWAFNGYAIRFSKNRCRLDFNSTHPCEIDTGGQTLWRVMKDAWGTYHEGWVHVTNEIVNVECVPEYGALHSELPYDLPQYYGHKSAYTCATWLRRIEASTGVKSFATAVRVDMKAEKCTLYYENHRRLKRTDETKQFFCYLRKTFGPRVLFPGFHSVCKIYVEDPIFVGLWELDFNSHFNLIPFLRRRRATMDDPSSVEVHLGDGFDGATAIYEDRQLLFRLGGKVRLKIPLRWHICIGPDTNYTQTFDASESQLGTIYRYDIGLDCAPFYGFAKSKNSSFFGFDLISLMDYHTLAVCKERASVEFPFGMWKVVVSTVGLGPCWAFGGGLDYSQMSLVPRLNTYSCFSTKHYKTIRPVPSCQYFVEAAEYTGFYTVDLFWYYIYSVYPGLSRGVNDDKFGHPSPPELKWKDGYKLTGLYEEYVVDLGDENICPDAEDPKVVPVYTYGGKRVGVIYRFDSDSYCDPWHVVVHPKDSEFTGFDKIYKVKTLKDCITKYKENHSKNKWVAIMRQGSNCTVYPNKKITLKEMDITASESKKEYTCFKRGRKMKFLSKLPATFL